MTEKKLDLGRQIVSFIGPEGSGKTTIARLLAAQAQKPYIATGNIFRDMAENDKTKYGDECRAMLAEHRYLDPQMLMDILVSRFSQDDMADGFILDGGFRTLEETVGFRSVLERSERNLPVSVVYLMVPRMVSIDRLVIGENARKRADDTIQGVLTRLSKFRQQLYQRIAFIKKQKDWRLLNVDATGTVEETLTKVCKILSE